MRILLVSQMTPYLPSYDTRLCARTETMEPGRWVTTWTPARAVA